MGIIYGLVGLIIGLWVGAIIASIVFERKVRDREDTAEAYRQSYYYLKNKRKSDDNLS